MAGNKKLQSALEMMTTYSFMIALVAIVLVVIVYFSIPTSQVEPGACNSFGSIRCYAAQYYIANALASSSTANVLLYFSNSGSSPANIISVNVVINGQTTYGACTTNQKYPIGNTIVNPGGNTICAVHLGSAFNLGRSVNGQYVLNADSCNSGVGEFAPQTCGFISENYTGTFLVYATQQPVTTVLAGSGSSTTTIPEYYVPINIVNNGNSPTPVPYQANVIVDSASYAGANEINSGWQNVEFTSGKPAYEGGKAIEAWVESGATNTAISTLIWLKLTSAISPHSSTTVYMNFMPTNVMSASGPTGEAPQLSSTYGKYDNGALVFNQYGGGGPGGWNSFTFIGGSWSTANGYLQQTSTSGSYGGGPAAVIEGTSYSVSGSYVLEEAFSYGGQDVARAGIIADGTPSGGDIFGYRFVGQQSSNGAGFLSFLNDGVAWAQNNGYQGSTSTPYTMQVTDNAGTWSGNLYSGYGINSGILTSLTPTPYTAENRQSETSGYVGISAAYCGSTCTTSNPITVQWFRVRAYPQTASSTGPLSPTCTLVEYYVPITLTNSQVSATPAPFQQLITVDSASYNQYINGQWSNVEFTTGADGTGTLLQAWVESNPSNTVTNTNVWVNLPNGLPADGSLTIYMDMMASNVMSASGPTGEAPQLSSTYGEYDNGAEVFNFYDNFAGKTINSGYTQVTPSGVTITQNNGVTISTSSSVGYGGLIYTTGFTPPFVYDADVTSVSGVAAGMMLQIGNTYSGLGALGYGFNYWGGSVEYGTMEGGFSAPQNPNLQIGTGVMSMAWASSSSQIYYKNYGSGTAGSQTILGFPSTMYLSLGEYYDSPSSSISVQWIRTRAYPPGGVMPAVSFGSGSRTYTPPLALNPPLGQAYVPITISNTGSSPAPAGYQEFIDVPTSSYTSYINSQWSNIEFTIGAPAYQGGVTIPAWVESGAYNTSSDTKVWLSLPAGIPAQGSVTVYMNFMPYSVMSASGPTGEAPQLSSTYGEYDNGADVFNYYNNFASYSDISGWTSGSGVTLSASDGLVLTSTSANVGAYSTYSTNPPFVYEAYGEAQQVTTGAIDAGIAYINIVSGMTGPNIGGPWIWGTSAPYSWEGCCGYFALGGSAPSLNTFYVFGESVGTSPLVPTIWSENYNELTASSLTATSRYMGFWADANDRQFYYWMRVRDYSPIGLEPGYSIGSIA